MLTTWDFVFHELIDTVELIIAHNAEFDIGFIDRELSRLWPAARIAAPSFCTMEGLSASAFRDQTSLDRADGTPRATA